MKKVLIIEDRTQRQEQFLATTDIKLDTYNFVENKIGKSYTKFKEELLKDSSILEEYQVIISHRSAFEENNAKVLDTIKIHCEKQEKYLILFSGGISTSYYSKEPYEQLSLNSKDFYSSNLKLFLDEVGKGNINLLLLAFGQRWKLNTVLNSLEKINTLTIDKMDYAEFYEKTGLETIEKIIDFNEFEYEEFDEGVVEQVKQKILNYINDELGIYYA